MLIPLKELVTRFNVKPSGVLHVGANVGEEAVQYEEQGIKNVVWIEPNPEVYNQLLSNVDQYMGKYPRYRCYNFAAGEENKDVILHISNNAGQSSSILPLGTHARNHPTVKYTHDIVVPMKRLDDFFKEIYSGGSDELDFLSMDIQGFELPALKGMGELLNQFKWVYLEVNKEQVYQGNALVGEVDQYLSKFGFKPRAEKWTSAKWGDKFWSK